MIEMERAQETENAKPQVATHISQAEVRPREEARLLAHDLTQKLSVLQGKQQLKEVAQAFFEGHDLDLAKQFSEPLNALAEEVPVQDVKTDVEDFGLLSALAESGGSTLPALQVGKRAVPLLPESSMAFDLLQELLHSFGNFQQLLRPILLQSLLRTTTPAGVETVPLSRKESQAAFFSGFEPFLAHRILGCISGQSQTSVQGAESPSTQATAPSAFERKFEPAQKVQPRGGGGGQVWTVHTARKGLALYCFGTHVARRNFIYLSAKTTPLDVFLNMGTWHLATQLTPGNWVWDEAVIEVPSQDPTFETQTF
jgi:hypothetical protein